MIRRVSDFPFCPFLISRGQSFDDSGTAKIEVYSTQARDLLYHPVYEIDPGWTVLVPDLQRELDDSFFLELRERWHKTGHGGCVNYWYIALLNIVITKFIKRRAVGVGGCFSVVLVDSVRVWC